MRNSSRADAARDDTNTAPAARGKAVSLPVEALVEER
jgi:hypothetical protein